MISIASTPKREDGEFAILLILLTVLNMKLVLELIFF